MSVFVSPGVQVREQDLSPYILALSTTALGIVGTAPKGPLDEAVFLSNVGSLAKTFGTPTSSHLAMFAAQQFLRQGRQLWFVRVAGPSAANASIAVDGVAVAAMQDNTEGGPFVFAAAAKATHQGTDQTATSNIVLDTSDRVYVAIDGQTPISIQLTAGATEAKADIAAEIDTALQPLGGECAITGTNQVTIRSQGTGPSQRFQILPVANDAYTELGLVTGTYTGTPDNSTLTVTDLERDDLDDLIFTEVDTVVDLTGDTTVDNVVDALNTAFTSASRPLTATNVNGRVRVEHTSLGLEYGFRFKAETAPAVSAAGDLGFTLATDYFGRGLFAESTTATFSAIGPGVWGDSLSLVIENGSLANTFRVKVYDTGVQVETFDNLVMDSAEATGGKKYLAAAINDVSTYITVVDTVANNGFPYNSTVTVPHALIGGDDDLANVGDSEYVGVAGPPETGLQIFASGEAIDINVLMVPGVSSAAVLTEVISICEARGDCFGLLDPPLGLTSQQVVDWHNGDGPYNDHAAYTSNYAGLFWPWVQVYDSASDANVWTPPSGHVSAVFARSDNDAEIWIAPAGTRRGGIAGGIQAEVSLSEANRGVLDLLYGDGNAVNPLATFADTGLVVWGQRTLQRVPTALDRINVRRMLLYLRKVIASSVRSFVFEPNDSATWRQFTGVVTPFLETVKNRRGLYEYKVVCDETTNTPDLIDAGQMSAQIFLRPTKAAEFIQVDLILTPTGASFEEILST
jgi:phage tail sheath protein FI